MSTETKTDTDTDKVAGKAADDKNVEADEKAADTTEAGAEGSAADGSATADADSSGTGSADAEAGADSDDDLDGDLDAEAGTDADESGVRASSGVRTGAAAVVSAALGFVSLSGSWVGTVASDRAALVGQMESSVSQSADVGAKMQAVYGDSWQLTALFGGAFALVALVVGVIALARPAFGAPGRVQAPWIKSVAWAGVALGVVGLLLAIAKYTDLIFALPSVPS
ncbi:hypothetical protein DSC45_17355 [Streptomyces sp. YIM 130001]|uniref:hypothetical protein n=1 Tax=Streptomyces sp. YIM 130001 TaxID=2259644 RepID=UPI000ED84D0B|nr:hypothetical protein [Streptomyces sp. YIM 130001]RII15598.1 hypothetical protein DSC45_17355 [Streptomyces sp. YIM 130001]